MNDARKINVFEDVISLMTGMWPTPLVRLKNLSKEDEIWAKLEFYNPFSHSIKDRPVWYMMKKALEKGMLKDTLYEATSGNVGISLSLQANHLGKKAKIFLPKGTPKYTIALLSIIGADIVMTDFNVIDWSMINYVKDMAKRDNVTNLNQFENDANFESHYEFTSKELIDQIRYLGKKPKAVIAGIGTSGHIAAISIRIKEEFKDALVIGVQPFKGSKIPGIKRVETKPKWLEIAKIDEVIDISREEAIKGVIEIARVEGLLVGMSSGAVYMAYKKIRSKLGKGLYILIFPDDIFKYVEVIYDYLSKKKNV